MQEINKNINVDNLQIIIVFLKPKSHSFSNQSELLLIMDPNVVEALRRGNPVVFFDISIGGSPAGRIRLELFKNKCPKVIFLCYYLYA